MRTLTREVPGIRREEAVSEGRAPAGQVAPRTLERRAARWLVAHVLLGLAKDSHHGLLDSGLGRAPYAALARAAARDHLRGRHPGGQGLRRGLLVCILLSVVVVMLESVASIRAQYGRICCVALEWIFTVLFTVEYVLRLACVGRPLRYAMSFFGVVDLLAICRPT